MANGLAEATNTARRASWVLLLCTLSSPAGCKAPVRLTPVQQAERASAEQDWARAGRLWAAQIREGGPGAQRAYLEAARASVGDEELDRARELLDEGLQRYPQDVDLWQERGNVLELMGFRRAAEFSLGRALELDSNRHSARLARAELRLELGLAASARGDIETCLQAGLDQPALWIAYARCLAALGEARPAFDAYARGLEQGSSDAGVLIAAAAVYMGGDLHPSKPRDRELVIAWLNQAVARAPQLALPSYWLGVLQLEDGNAFQAEASLERALAADPEHLPSLERLAGLVFERGELERADLLARRALAIDPSPARSRALAPFLLGEPER